MEQLPANSEAVAVATLILGGRVSGASLGQKWQRGATQEEGTPIPGFVQVAKFLQEVMPRRMGRLWSLRNTQRPDNVEVVIPQIDRSANALGG